MEKFTVRLNLNSYDVYFGGESIEQLLSFVAGKKTLVITDEKVNELYGDFIENTFLSAYKFVVPKGEKAKDFIYVQKILQYMLENNFDRKSCVIAFGGGVVGDLSGFVASVYMRGIDYYQMPTTLLSQVDSCLGGKTGINFYDIKNVVGSFYQPKAIFISTQFLSTLETSEWKCGHGEIIKTALLDKKVYAYIQKCGIPKQLDKLNELIRLCLECKARIVMADERESGERKNLNLGHTIAHAFEELNLSGNIRHGEYVLIGLYYETKISEKLQIISGEKCKEVCDFILHYCDNILNILDMDAFYKKLVHDKKNQKSGISFILLCDLFKTKEVLLTKKDIYQILGEINESIA